jgi:hypothetical protein
MRLLAIVGAETVAAQFFAHAGLMKALGGGYWEGAPWTSPAAR